MLVPLTLKMLSAPAAGRLLVFFLAIVMLPVQAVERQPRIVGGVESAPSDWPFMAALMSRTLDLSVGGTQYDAIPLFHTPAKPFSGRIVDCGLAFVTCRGVDGQVCLIQRGETYFTDKLRNCEAGGGVGAIIYNNASGNFSGVVELNSVSIPAVSVSGEDGQRLLQSLGMTANYDYSNKTPEASFCGGSYLGGKWVVTAAHCVVDERPDAIFVNVGGHDLTTDQQNVLGVDRIITHPDYDPDTVRNDVALLELTSEPRGVQPMTLATEAVLNAALVNHATVTILGRGGQVALKPNEQPTFDSTVVALYEAEISLVTNTECNAAFQNYYAQLGSYVSDLVYDEAFCAGRPEGGVGACFGDSGGPLLLQDGGQYYQLGLTSWGLGCAQPDLYDVYTRLPYYKTQIENIMSGKQNGFISQPSQQTPTVPGSSSGSAGGGGAFSFGWLFTLLILVRRGRLSGWVQ